MAQKSEPVFIVQRRDTRNGDMSEPFHFPWENVRVADDRADARAYRDVMNRKSKVYEYRVDPKRITKL